MFNRGRLSWPSLKRRRRCCHVQALHCFSREARLLDEGRQTPCRERYPRMRSYSPPRAQRNSAVATPRSRCGPFLRDQLIPHRGCSEVAAYSTTGPLCLLGKTLVSSRRTRFGTKGTTSQFLRAWRTHCLNQFVRIWRDAVEAQIRISTTATA